MASVISSLGISFMLQNEWLASERYGTQSLSEMCSIVRTTLLVNRNDKAHYRLNVAKTEPMRFGV